MNIKGLGGPQVMTNMRPVDKVDRTIHSDQSRDRDANGQQAFGDPNEQHREPMSEEQIEKALEHLRNLAAVKDHKWTVNLVVEDGKKFVLVKDNMGALIRRIPELDLWSLPVDEFGNKGHLLTKAA